jgi:hypothetical protein
VRLLPKFLWSLLALFAVVNALGALRYLLPHVPFPAELDNFSQRRIGLSLHALGGGAVLLGWCASLWIAPHSQTGWVASSGFLALGAAWIVTTGLAVRFILRGDAIGHRRWMIRSYALTAAAITLRMYLPLIFAFHWPFSVAYPAIAWLCWIPNALAAEVYLRFMPTPSGITLPANLAGSSPQSVSQPPRSL